MKREYNHINLTGQQIGKWTVIKRAPSIERGGKTETYFECQCACGTTKNILSANLRRGATKSCGCEKSNGRRKSDHAGWKGHGEIPKTYFNYLERAAQRRTLQFEVTIEEVWELFLKQNRKCALTGLTLNFGTSVQKFDTTASLDRIDSDKGYKTDNIQWVHKNINWMKGDFAEEEFVKFCKLVAAHHE